MFEAGEDLALALESLAGGAAQRLAHELQCDNLRESLLRSLGEIDGSHPACSQQADEPVGANTFPDTSLIELRVFLEMVCERRGGQLHRVGGRTRCSAIVFCQQAFEIRPQVLIGSIKRIEKAMPPVPLCLKRSIEQREQPLPPIRFHVAPSDRFAIRRDKLSGAASESPHVFECKALVVCLGAPFSLRESHRLPERS